MDALPYGVVVVDRSHEILQSNPAARELVSRVGSPESICCHELWCCDGPGQPCAHGCLGDQARRTAAALPEVRVDTREGTASALWITAAPLADGTALLHLRPGERNDRRRRCDPHWLTGIDMRICVLGRTVVRSGATELGGQWLGERAGQVLKYLVCRGARGATTDEIAHAIWPDSGRSAINSTRHAIHRLRGLLEPGRSEHGRSSFVIGRPGGYALDLRTMRLDVTEFERSIDDGTAALRLRDETGARSAFARALELYGGDFLADEPYADWAYDERARLHDLAVDALRATAEMARRRGATDEYHHALRRLCSLEPYDALAHRELIASLHATGHLSEAKRRYAGFAQRMRREFDAAPGFDLKSLGAPRS